MRVLLLSSYELGQQPLGIAVPATALVDAGHEVRATDLSLQALAEDDLDWAECLVASVPMHTALQLTLSVLEHVRAGHPELPVALHGLYAPVAEGHRILRNGDLLVAGDPIPALIAWLAQPPGPSQAAQGTTGAVVNLGPPRPDKSAGPPRRSLLPSLDSYAQLVLGEERRTTGSTVLSTGCNHRCRHCPVAAVYGGRSRPTPAEDVVADAKQLVAMGAEHISFADPDFLNRPGHSMAVLRHLHEKWPELTFDATVKVEHVIRHAALWPELAGLGLIFVVSAFESRDDEVLRILDKGHTAEDEHQAVWLLRSHGIDVRPSWLPFSPWTTLKSLAAILDFSAREDLVASTDTVQYAIRLLLPRKSLLLSARHLREDQRLATSLRGQDLETGSVRWVSSDPRLDVLQLELAQIAEVATAKELSAQDAFELVWRSARSGGAPLSYAPPEPERRSPVVGDARPRLSEAWFCCAEPTRAQSETATARNLRVPA